MDASVIKKIVSVAKELDLNMEIVFDNQEILNTKIQGTIVNFDDANEVISYVRISDSPTQMFKAPFEMRFRTYETVHNIAIQADNKNMNKVIEKLAQYTGDKKAAMLDFINHSTANNTYHATPSTVNVMDREGTKPSLYRTDEYGAAGEARKKTEPYKIPNIQLNEDGSIPEDANIPQPKRIEDSL